MGDQLVALDGDVAADGGGVAGGDDFMVELAPFDALVGGDGDGLAAGGGDACGLAGGGDRGLGARQGGGADEGEGGQGGGAG